MVLIDSNALILVILGIMNPELINDHKTTSIYDISDYELVMMYAGTLENIIVLPNTLTEVDNLLNKSFNGNRQYDYILTMINIIDTSVEKVLSSSSVINLTNSHFPKLGLTDSIILHIASEYELLITSDSDLSDHARSLGINVLDLVGLKNENLRKY